MDKRGDSKILGMTLSELIELVIVIVAILITIYLIWKFSSNVDKDAQNIKNFEVLTSVVDGMIDKQNDENTVPFYMQKDSLLVVFDDSSLNSSIFTRPNECKDKGCIAICKKNCIKVDGNCLRKELCKAYDNINFTTPSNNYIAAEGGDTVLLHLIKKESNFEIKIAEES